MDADARTTADRTTGTAGTRRNEPRPGPTVDGRAMTVAVGVPVLAAAAVVGTDVWLGDRLGDVIATHWGPSGEPDDWSSRTGFVVAMVVFGAVVPLAITVTAGFARVWTALRRSLLAIGVWAAVLTGGLGVVGLVVQADGAPGTLGLAPVLWLSLGGIPVAVLAALVPQDLVPPVLATTTPARHLPRSQSDVVPEHAIGRVARLRVSEGVVTVRLWRWTVLRVPVAEVDEAHVGRSTAWDWGGWGLRHQPGTNRYAYLGSGREGVDLHRADGTRWFVTTPRAEEVAGVVNTLADGRTEGREATGSSEA